MEIIKRLFFLVTLVIATQLSAKVIDLGTDQVLLQMQGRADLLKKEFFWHMAKSKYYLLLGNTDLAALELGKAPYMSNDLKYIKEKMYALIAFIKEDYEQSYKRLNLPYFQKNETAMRQVCIMQTYNMLALKKYKEIKSYFGMCKVLQKNSLTSNFSWGLNTVDLILKDRRIRSGDFLQIRPETLYSMDFLRSWLKEGLYHNQEQEIIKYIGKIPKKAYKIKEIRELLALVLYRAKKYDQSLDFIENIHSANAENIRGNISLQKKQYELAFAHFQLALKAKKNSLNAIERLIPLSWLLEQYEESINILNNYHAKKINPIKKDTLLIAHLLHTKHYKKAYEYIKKLDAQHVHQMPHILSLMAMYTELMLKKREDMQKHALITCKEYDGLSCWLMMQSQIWNDITAFLKDEKSIAPNARYDLEALQKAPEITPLKEKKVINQAEIEELDYGFYHPN